MSKEADEQAGQAADGEEDLSGDLPWNRPHFILSQTHFDFTQDLRRLLTERLTAVQGGGEAAGVGVGGNVGGGGVQQRVPDDHRVDDALTGDGVEHGRGLVCGQQGHDLHRRRERRYNRVKRAVSQSGRRSSKFGCLSIHPVKRMCLLCCLVVIPQPMGSKAFKMGFFLLLILKGFHSAVDAVCFFPV